MNKMARFVILVYFAFIAQAHSFERDPRSSHKFYTEAFGQVSEKAFPLSNRVSDVFTKLLRISDDAGGKSPSIVLLNSESWPWAIALPDNTIMLTVGAVNLCFEGVSKERGDIRLAMLLGHELAHLAEDDYWHRDVYLALSTNDQDENNEVLNFIGKRSGLVKSSQWNDIVRDRELKADDKGAIYALLAGFDIRELFPENEESFFHFWVNKTQTEEHSFYLTAEQRTNYLKRKLGSMLELADAFKMGMVLMSMGYHEEAQTLYTGILRRFPAQEVYNNMGYLRLMQSKAEIDRKEIKVEKDVLFWLPTEVDINPMTPMLSRGQGDAFIVNKQMLEAIGFFEMAVAKNPLYLSASLNLASALFSVQRFNQAAAVMDDAEKLNTRDPRIKLMQSLILFLNLRDKVDINQYVYDQIKQIIDDNPGFIMASYNLALLYEIDHQPKLAKVVWLALAQNHSTIPEIYREVIAQKASVKLSYKPANKIRPLLAMASTYSHQDQDEPQTQQLTKDDEALKIVRQNDQVQYIVHGTRPLLSITRIPKEKLSPLLTQCCGQPVSIQSSMLGDLFVYQKDVAVFNAHASQYSELILNHNTQDKRAVQGRSTAELID